MAALKLPTSSAEFLQTFYRISKSGENTETEAVLRNGWAYTHSAMLTGRPFQSGLIVLAGYSGSGKSTLINVLLADENLCPTSTCKSETSCPTIITKSLCVTNTVPNIQGNLTFVDVPGSLDTDLENEVKNFASVHNLFETMEDLQPRSELTDMFPSARPSVFPNMVLFVIRATDNRIIGNNTGLRKALEQLKNSGNIIDRIHPNLIVVITNVIHFGLQPDAFNKNLNEYKGNIRSVVEEVLGISDFEIVPIENQPKLFRLPPREDFFELPNGDISHYNLIQAMTKRFDKNNDLIGRLFLSWYLADECTERLEPPIVTEHETVIPLKQIHKAKDLLAKINNLSVDSVPVYTFQLLGHGYCPVKEEVKSFGSLVHSNLSSLQEMQVVNVDSVKFQVPAHIKTRVESINRFRHMSHFEKESYEKRTALLYGREAKLSKLTVEIGEERKWAKDAGKSSKKDTGFISFAKEVEVVNVQLDNLKDILKDSPILNELDKLPDVYTVETGIDFKNFFSEWGTHIIYKEALGGYIQMDCILSSLTGEKDAFQVAEKKIGKIFKEMLCVSDETKKDELIQSLKLLGVSTQHVKFVGGNTPDNFKLEDFDQKLVNDWVESVSQKPVELRHSIKLLPYYILTNDKKHDALRMATQDYMQGLLKYMKDFGKKNVLSRNEFSKHSAALLKKVSEKVAYSVTLTVITRIASSPQAQTLISGLLTAGGTDAGMIMQAGGIMDGLEGLYDYFRSQNWF